MGQHNLDQREYHRGSSKVKKPRRGRCDYYRKSRIGSILHSTQFDRRISAECQPHYPRQWAAIIQEHSITHPARTHRKQNTPFRSSRLGLSLEKRTVMIRKSLDTDVSRLSS